MAYLTQSDIANLLLENQAGENFSKIIQDIIDTHLSSQDLSEMQEAVRYYNCDHDINDVDFRTYYVRTEAKTDTNAANNHIVHPFFTLQVDQKAGYIAGNPIAFGVEGDEETDKADIINDLLGEDFAELCPQWITRASVRGYEFLHPYINEHGEFDYVLIDAQQCIPVYDSQYQKELIYMIRFYQVDYVDSSGSSQEIYKVEWWDKNSVTFYTQTGKGSEFVLDPTEAINPRGHFKRANYDGNGNVIPGTEEWLAWDYGVPFIKLSNNDNEVSDLKTIKPLIDNYDRSVSVNANKLEDITDAIWELAGYSGTDLAEFRTNLKVFKVINTQEGGSAKPITMEIPYEAHNAHLDKLEDNIYIFGRAVDPRKDKFGNSPSGVALRYMYILLDLKSNILIRKMKKSLREFMHFVAQYAEMARSVDVDPAVINFTFNKSILINEFETVQMLQMSKGLISDETIVENHPRVDDPQQELERMEEDRALIPDIDLDPEPVNAD
ncbi:MAG: phage portal protein [Deltaproteobacteria bacterium]|nr:phage portal protein [Deltaproteobacteria bacterium]